MHLNMSPSAEQPRKKVMFEIGSFLYFTKQRNHIGYTIVVET